MGRESGFIALKSSFLSKAADVVLIPEEKWYIKGSKGLLSYILEVLTKQKHCLVCIAEGAFESCED